MRSGMVLALVLAAAQPSPADELEYPVKAEFIERFTRFIEWPPDAFQGPGASFVLCLVGDSPISPHLARLARERRIKERPVAYRRIKASAEPDGCHVLFIGTGERARLKQILGRTSGRPILTVGDSEGLGREGVLVNLFGDEEGHIRFEICSSEVKKSSLQFSAQLLKLARLVQVVGSP